MWVDRFDFTGGSYFNPNPNLIAPSRSLNVEANEVLKRTNTHGISITSSYI